MSEPRKDSAFLKTAGGLITLAANHDGENRKLLIDAAALHMAIVRFGSAAVLESAEETIKQITGGETPQRRARSVKKTKPRRPRGEPEKPTPPPAPKKAVAATPATSSLEDYQLYGVKVGPLDEKLAELAVALARGNGNPIGREFLTGKLWPQRSKESADSALSTATNALKAKLEPFGLEVVITRGGGIGLRKSEA